MSTPTELTQEQKRIKIAEALGWRDCKLMGGPEHFLPVGDPPNSLSHRDIPDYFRDLNAMHEAEKSLDALHRPAYIRELWTACHSGGSASHYCEAIFATADKRAEAFGRALQLW